MIIRNLVTFVFLTTTVLGAQNAAAPSEIDEAFRLAGVRGMLDSLPSHVNDMTSAAVAQFPRDQRREFEPVIKDVSIKFLDPDSFYRQLRAYFVKHYDAAHMATFLALERTPVYRTMHRLEDAAETPASQAARRRFENSLKSDPPAPTRVDILQRLDEARNSTDLEVRIVTGIVNAMAAGLGAQMPADLETQSEAFKTKLRPILANNILHANLFTYRNVENADLEDYVAAVRQKDIEWFNRNLQSAILAVVNERSARAADAIKTKVSQPAK